MIYLMEETEGYSQRDLARMLLQYGLYMEYGLSGQPSIRADQLGKPYLIDYPQIHFNYSHSRQGILCGIHREEIGVDIEKIISYKDNLARRICHPQEMQRMEETEDKDRLMTRIWTAKESYLKYKGIGIRMDLRKLNLIQCEENAFRLEECFFQVLTEKYYGIAICGKEPGLEIRKVTLKNLLAQF